MAWLQPLLALVVLTTIVAAPSAQATVTAPTCSGSKLDGTPLRPPGSEYIRDHQGNIAGLKAWASIPSFIVSTVCSVLADLLACANHNDDCTDNEAEQVAAAQITYEGTSDYEVVYDDRAPVTMSEKELMFTFNTKGITPGGDLSS